MLIVDAILCEAGKIEAKKRADMKLVAARWKSTNDADKPSERMCAALRTIPWIGHMISRERLDEFPSSVLPYVRARLLQRVLPLSPLIPEE